jgi:enamine deaminase RidA (YjgF/YER057c/UK114 family)
MEKKIVNPWTWQDKFGFVQANDIIGAKRHVFCSGQVSVDNEGNPIHAGDMAAQIHQIFDNLEAVLHQAGVQLSDVVRLTYYTTDIEAFLQAGAALGERLGKGGCKPASTLLGVSSLFHPDIVIEIEATVVV